MFKKIFEDKPFSTIFILSSISFALLAVIASAFGADQAANLAQGAAEAFIILGVIGLIV